MLLIIISKANNRLVINITMIITIKIIKILMNK